MEEGEGVEVEARQWVVVEEVLVVGGEVPAGALVVVVAVEVGSSCFEHGDSVE